MSALRLISLASHGALEMLAGILTMTAPFVLGFGAAATVLAVLVGAAMIGLALSATSGEPGVSRGTLPIASHHAADHGLALGIAGSAAVVAIAGDSTAAIALAAIAVLYGALNLSTRYSTA